jgi:hypothetical protein
MSHPALDRAWAYLENERRLVENDAAGRARCERIHETLSKLEIELYRLDQAQAQSVPAGEDA